MNSDKSCKNCQHLKEQHYTPVGIKETEIDSGRYIQKCLESRCECVRFEIQNENDELCAKCQHIYGVHGMFTKNHSVVTEICDKCECFMFVPSGKFEK